MSVEVVEHLDTPHPASALFACVEDLETYPRWLAIVPRAARLAGGDPPAWSVDLKGRLGPFARSKRLRMVRSIHEPSAHVRFERAEVDGREHSPWVLDAIVDADGDGDHSRLTMRLTYGGSLWVPVLDRLLRQEIERSKPKLLRLLDGEFS